MPSVVTQPQLRMTRIGLSGADVVVEYRTVDGSQGTFRPDSVNVGLGGMLFEWHGAPVQLEKVLVKWIDPPFMDTNFYSECEVVQVKPDGVHVRFAFLSDEASEKLREWLSKIGRVVVVRKNYAVETSKWYTWATVFSALGLFCGALGLLLPIINESQIVAKISTTLVVFMVLSIALFALARWYAGKLERLAIKTGQA